jgi:hypothetical protein
MSKAWVQGNEGRCTIKSRNSSSINRKISFHALTVVTVNWEDEGLAISNLVTKIDRFLSANDRCRSQIFVWKKQWKWHNSRHTNKSVKLYEPTFFQQLQQKAKREGNRYQRFECFGGIEKT